MPVMNFDLEDGLPAVSFSLKDDDCARFVAFMDDCNRARETPREAAAPPPPPRVKRLMVVGMGWHEVYELDSPLPPPSREGTLVCFVSNSRPEPGGVRLQAEVEQLRGELLARDIAQECLDADREE